LLGYSVECALKACVARQFREHEVPERKLVNSFYTHSLIELLVISGLQPEFRIRVRYDANFEHFMMFLWRNNVRAGCMTPLQTKPPGY
jgi:hypothetical protein